MTSDEIAETTNGVLSKYGVVVINGLLTIGLFIMGYWLNGQAAAQAQFNDRLTHVEQAEAGTESDIKAINNTITFRSSARDSQFASVSSQGAALSARVDHLENAFGDKLDKVAGDISSIKQDIAAIKAISGGHP